MKSVTRSFATLALVLGGLAPLAANGLELRGFRGVAWGDSADALGRAAVEHLSGDVNCYVRERENMLFGDSPLTQVRYCFHRDHLFMVALDSAAAMNSLLAEFQRTYGIPKARSAVKATWGSESSGARAELVALAANGARSRLTIYSNKFDPALATRGADEVPPRVAAAR